MNKLEYNIQYASELARDDIFVPINLLRKLIEYPTLPTEIAYRYDEERKATIKSNIVNRALMYNLINFNKS
jgi:hypothetical protein